MARAGRGSGRPCRDPARPRVRRPATAPAGAVDPLLVDWCVRHLGSPPVEQFFGVQRLSAVHGLRLADGREVVLKVRGALDRQAGVHRGPRGDVAGGDPLPAAVGRPGPAGRGRRSRCGSPGVRATSSWTPARWRSTPRPGRARAWPRWVPSARPGTPGCWRGWSAAAPAVDELTTLDPPVPWLNWDHGDPGRVWPPPASDRWDPHRIDDEIDPLIHEVARRARARLLAPGRGDAAAGGGPRRLRGAELPLGAGP